MRERERKRERERVRESERDGERQRERGRGGSLQTPIFPCLGFGGAPESVPGGLDTRCSPGRRRRWSFELRVLGFSVSGL